MEYKDIVATAVYESELNAAWPFYFAYGSSLFAFILIYTGVRLQLVPPADVAGTVRCRPDGPDKRLRRLLTAYRCAAASWTNAILFLHWRRFNYSAVVLTTCLLYTSPSPRDGLLSRMPSSA